MGTARLTVTDDIDLDRIDVHEGIETCTACQHPRDSHDATSQRFCAATSTLGVARRCICRVEALDGAQRAASAHRFGFASSLPRGV